MGHNCTYDEVGPLRKHSEARRYFFNHIDLFINLAIGLKRYYIMTNNETFANKDIERRRTLARHIQYEEKKWIDLLEGKRDTFSGRPVIEILSDIIAGLVVGHEKDFENISNKEWTTKVKSFKNNLKKVYAL